MKFLSVLGSLMLLTSASTNVPAAAMSKGACPDSVRIIFLDIAVPPLYNGSGTEFANPPGYLIGWIQSAVARTGCAVRPELMRRPVKRAYQELEHGETDILATVPNTPEHALARVSFLASRATWTNAWPTT